jgi:hypothetical protein
MPFEKEEMEWPGAQRERIEQLYSILWVMNIWRKITLFVTKTSAIHGGRAVSLQAMKNVAPFGDFDRTRV